MSAVREQLGPYRALRIEEAILEIEKDDFVFGVAIAGEDLVGLSALGPFRLVFHREDAKDDHASFGELAAKGLRDGADAIGHFTRRGLHAKIPLYLSAGALRDDVVVGAAEKNGDARSLALGKIEVPIGGPVKHHRGDVSRVPHVDGAVFCEVLFPGSFTLGAQSGPLRGNRIAKKDNFRTVCLCDLLIHPFEFTMPITILNLVRNGGAGGRSDRVQEIGSGFF